jgi:iron complex outermembrane receptor protein
MLHMNTEISAASQAVSVAGTPGTAPRYQLQGRSLLSLRKNFEWDSGRKFVSALATQNVPGYLPVDSRLGWRVDESFEISLTGQDLGSGRHIEFVDLSGF